MSSRQLEERWEREINQHIARALEMSIEDIESLSFEVENNESDEGVVYGQIIRFHLEHCDPDALSRVPNLENDWVMIAPLPVGPDEPE
ncbi:hypothetical protein [Leisingera sp.]|uniref:hypothetical protein n=1 Tax=Leisingera sp. TaxID=1879318 RepID=UPI002B270D16|nr:hypothetical protein [Leisingera sp.]